MLRYRLSAGALKVFSFDGVVMHSVDTAPIEIAPRWRDYDKADLDATVTRLIVRRPAG